MNGGWVGVISKNITTFPLLVGWYSTVRVRFSPVLVIGCFYCINNEASKESIMAGWTASYPEMNCELENGSGITYEEFSCMYPTIGKTYFSFEAGYDPIPVRNWMQDHQIVPIAAVIGYGLFCVFGKMYFADRKPLSWRTTLSYWNLGLSTFSAIGFCRTSVMLIHNLTHYSLEGNLCNDPEASFGSGSSGLWVQLFILSKFP